MRLDRDTEILLSDLENRIDPETEEDYRAQWGCFWENPSGEEPFMPHRKKMTAPVVSFPKININDAIGDYQLMLRHQLTGVSGALASENGLPAVRANYGTGILSSLFGAKIFMMPYENDTLPTTRVIAPEDIDRLLDRGIPDLTEGFGGRVFEMGEVFLEVFRKYPKLLKYCDVYHPDLQGPLDIAELLLGSELFYCMYDEPEKVHAFLSLITDTYQAFMEKWQQLFPTKGEYSTHWGSFVMKGEILLRSDSAMNVSPALYQEFSLPYDTRLLEHFHGGAVHFCGRGDHYIDLLSRIPGVYAINMSQPQYNDMEKIFACTLDRNIRILGYDKEHVKNGFGRKSGRYHGLLHCI